MLREMLLELCAAVDSEDKKIVNKILRELRSVGMDQATAMFLVKNRKLWEAEKCSS